MDGAGTISEQNQEYTVRTDVFTGPLDLLLTLIQKRKLFISDVSLSSVTEDYISYTQSIEEFPVADSAHFVLVASTLILIKSKSLLPNFDLSYEEEEDIEELQHRLKIYQKIKNLSEHTKNIYGNRVMLPGKPKLARRVMFSPTSEVTVQSLAETLDNILEKLPKRDQIPQREIKKVVSLKETINQLSSRISKSVNSSFSKFSGYKKGGMVTKQQRQSVIIIFLAMLELVKRGTVHVSQSSHFEDIEMGNIEF